MKKQLLLFNAGLQTKIQPHLIEPNQASSCINIDLSKGSIAPYYGLEANGTTTGKYIYFNNGTLIANSDATDIRSYATFGNRIYWTDGTFNSYGLSRYDGTSAGIEATAPAAPDGTMGFVLSGTTGGLNGDYSYCYTYVDTDGIESAPSAFFATTTTGNQDNAITISGETNVPADIAFRRIYRTGGVNPTYNLVAEVTDPTLTYTDITRDIDISRIELSTFDNGTPPSNLTNLIENNGTMWASVDDRVYFSSNGQPEYWNSLDFVTLNDTCIGLGKFADAVLAFTKSDAYLITGYDKNTISSRLLPYREGCINHDTIANVGDYLLWVSYNGVCIFNGSEVVLLTRNMLSWNEQVPVADLRFSDFGDLRFDSDLGFNIGKAIGIDGHYYAIFQDGVLDIDVLNKQVASTIYKENAFSLYYDSNEDVLNIVSGTASPYNIEQFDFDLDTHMEATWTTGFIQDEGYAIKKQYRKIELDNTPVSVVARTNDNKIFTVNGKRQFFLPAGFIGNYIQLEIKTTNEIRSCMYEYGTLK